MTVSEEKNGKKTAKQKDVFDPFRLKLCLDTRSFAAYENGGMMTQVSYNAVVFAFVPS